MIIIIIIIIIIINIITIIIIIVTAVGDFHYSLNSGQQTQQTLRTIGLDVTR